MNKQFLSQMHCHTEFCSAITYTVISVRAGPGIIFGNIFCAILYLFTYLFVWLFILNMMEQWAHVCTLVSECDIHVKIYVPFLRQCTKFRCVAHTMTIKLS